MADRIVSPKNRTEEVGLDVGLRPQSLDEYIGQDRVKENLRILLEAATGRAQDVEFGFTGDGTLVVFQVRRVATARRHGGFGE